mgnify:FL=1
MRQTKLNRTAWAVMAAVVIIVVVASLLRTRAGGGDGAGNKGAQLFREKGCSQCHYADRTEDKLGPGLKGVLQREQLPVSGRPATRENVKEQLVNPVDSMPSYENRLAEEEIQLMLDYLESL